MTDTGPHSPVEAALAAAFTAEWGRLVSVLIRVTGDWALAEECAAEAFATATEHWPSDGVPASPGAWLMTTARNRALDRLRRSANEIRKLREVAVTEPEYGTPADHDLDDSGVADDRLRLIFTCCHPALSPETRVALALRTLCGLTVAEIARAFGVSEPAMAKRLTRARAKITHAGIPYRVPPAHLLPERLPGVLSVLYLLYFEGYAATAGPRMLREDLSAEALRLARLLARLMPDEAEVLGLLALELFHDARRAGRVDGAGRLVPLEEQDRSRWDGAQIAAAGELLTTAQRRASRPGPYLLQAAVAAQHATATSPQATDWAELARLYAALGAVAPSPYVELSRAVAVGMAQGPDAGLELVAAIEQSGELKGFHLLPATRADLLRRAGRLGEAARAYQAALALVVNDVERDYLRRRLVEVGG